MKMSFLPAFTVPCVTLNRKTVFHKQNEKVVIHAPGKLIRQLIDLCDGTRSISDVIIMLKGQWDKNCVLGLIKELCRREVLVDNRGISNAFWTTVENPSRFPSLLSNKDVVSLIEKSRKRQEEDRPSNVYKVSPTSFGQLLEKRRSVRYFSDEPVSFQSVSRILWAAYGEISSPNKSFSRRTVPSAGALYPISICVVLFKQTGDLQEGIYRVWLGKARTVGFRLISADILSFYRSSADPMMFDGAHGAIVVCGNIQITTEKYGNRGMLYTILEAGYTAQNFHLSALELGIGTVELGGFIDRLVSEALDLPKNVRPLTTIVFGREKTSADTSSTVDMEIESYWPVTMAGTYRLPFSMAFARVSSKDDPDWSSGRDVNPQLAYTKALAEAQEWHACGLVPDNLVHARLSELDNALDPRQILKFGLGQYRTKGFPFKPFDDSLRYRWAKGVDELRGTSTWILADCVYFPYYPKTPPYNHANSSGVAAHPDRLQAIRNGVHELIERDSFMIVYLAKLSLPTVSERSLPGHIQKRIQHLRKNGFRVWVKDQTLDLAPVVFVFVQNERLTFTTCAACSNFSTEEALDHAMMEVESSVLYRLTNGASKPIKLSQVKFPGDHGTLYEQRQHFRKADFMAYGGPLIKFGKVGQNSAQSWQGLLDRFTINGWPLVTVQIKTPSKRRVDSELHVVKSIVPGVIPISFGQGLEPLGMDRIRAVAAVVGSHWSGMTRFPHPYT
jgi:ribosomal protein S12 methylthiotransferase accessory factor